MKFSSIGRLLLVPGIVWSTLVVAHHSATAHYLMDKMTSVTGIATEFRIINPHSRLNFEVKDSAGKVEKWIAEGESASVLLRQGWKGDEIKQGDRITVNGHPARDGSNMIEWTSIILANGKEIGGANGLDKEREQLLDRLEKQRRDNAPKPQ